MDKSPPESLARSLGLGAGVAIVVSNVIGSGIFLSSGFLARDLGNPLLLMAAWVLGGGLALAGALSYAELGAWLPRAGGEYAFLREAFGPLPAFLTGWASWRGLKSFHSLNPMTFAAQVWKFHL